MWVQFTIDPLLSILERTIGLTRGPSKKKPLFTYLYRIVFSFSYIYNVSNFIMVLVLLLEFLLPPITLGLIFICVILCVLCMCQNQTLKTFRLIYVFAESCCLPMEQTNV